MEQLRLSKSPNEMVWRQVDGLLAICGIGFTMACLALALEGGEVRTMLLMIVSEPSRIIIIGDPR